MASSPHQIPQPPSSAGAPSRLRHVLTSVVAAAVVTASIVIGDLQRSGAIQLDEGIRWARQVASQAEGLTLQAREAGEKDPVGWAVGYLAQGVEPRLVRITRVEIPGLTSQEPESFALDGDEGLFEYAKLLVPESGIGVRINISLGYAGFFGTKTRLGSHLLAAALFALWFLVAFLSTGHFFGFNDTRVIREMVGRWLKGAKAQLTQHGIHVREMVRQAQRLAVSSHRARDRVGDLRMKIHAGLHELHDTRKTFTDVDTVAARAETLASEATSEAIRLGPNGKRIAELTSDIHRCLVAMRAANRKSQEMVANLEKKIEPWSTDADEAFHSFDEVKDATQALGKHIRGTTETLLGQAKLIQGLNLELNGGAPTPLPEGSSEPVAVLAAESSGVGTVAVTARAGAGTAGVAAGAATTAQAIVDATRAIQTSHSVNEEHEPSFSPSRLAQLPEPLPPVEERVSRPLRERLRRNRDVGVAGSEKKKKNPA
jgi:hypothetical protein